MTQPICRKNKFGFCKYDKTCRYKHVDEECTIEKCDVFGHLLLETPKQVHRVRNGPARRRRRERRAAARCQAEAVKASESVEKAGQPTPTENEGEINENDENLTLEQLIEKRVSKLISSFNENSVNMNVYDEFIRTVEKPLIENIFKINLVFVFNLVCINDNFYYNLLFNGNKIRKN